MFTFNTKHVQLIFNINKYKISIYQYQCIQHFFWASDDHANVYFIALYVNVRGGEWGVRGVSAIKANLQLKIKKIKSKGLKVA